MSLQGGKNLFYVHLSLTNRQFHNNQGKFIAIHLMLNENKRIEKSVKKTVEIISNQEYHNKKITI